MLKSTGFTTAGFGVIKMSSFTGPLVQKTSVPVTSEQVQAVVKWASDPFFQIRLRYNANTHVRTLCLPITKEILLLQGLTKLDQLVSSTMYSPFRAQKRMDEGSMGCPAYW